MDRSPVEFRERQLRATERRLQRRFIQQYKAQVEIISPVLYERGVGVGTAIRDALLGGSTSKVNTTYKEVVTYRTPGLKLVGRLMWIDGSTDRCIDDITTRSLAHSHQPTAPTALTARQTTTRRERRS